MGKGQGGGAISLAGNASCPARGLKYKLSCLEQQGPKERGPQGTEIILL